MHHKLPFTVSNTPHDVVPTDNKLIWILRRTDRKKNTIRGDYNFCRCQNGSRWLFVLDAKWDLQKRQEVVTLKPFDVLLVVDFGRVLWQETYDTEVLNGFRDAARKCKTNRCPISEKNEADEMRIWQFGVSSKLEPSRRERAFLLSNNEASRAYRKHRCFVLEGLISFNPSEQPKRLRLFWTIRSHYCYSNKDRSRFVF
jgi:hypothetical protein